MSLWCVIKLEVLHYVYFRKYRSTFANEEAMMFCLRVMVGVIILYDHVHPVGAFAKTSPIDVRNLCYFQRDSCAWVHIVSYR